MLGMVLGKVALNTGMARLLGVFSANSPALPIELPIELPVALPVELPVALSFGFTGLWGAGAGVGEVVGKEVSFGSMFKLARATGMPVKRNTWAISSQQMAKPKSIVFPAETCAARTINTAQKMDAPASGATVQMLKSQGKISFPQGVAMAIINPVSATNSRAVINIKMRARGLFM